MAKKRKTGRATKRGRAAKRGPQRIVIDLTDVKDTLAGHIRTVERIVRAKEAKLKRAGGRGTLRGKEITPGLLQAKQMLRSMQSAQLAMYACCGCEPAQICPFAI